MAEVYGISNCNTVKKARNWLQENHVPYTFHDFKKEGVTVKKLQEWCKVFGWQNLVNKAGTTWKKLSEEEKEGITNQSAAIKLMMTNTSIIRRPVIEADGSCLIRFDEEEYAEKLRKN